jgi:hypothetical protein
LATRGSALRAEGNATLRTVCAKCGKSISTEAGHPHPLDETLARETWGLVGYLEGRKTVFATCDACHASGWRPPDYVRVE